MKGQTAKKGDRALIVPYIPVAADHKYMGTICQVVSDPYLHKCKKRSTLPAGYYRINDIVLHDGLKCSARTADLIPLPPDDEANRLFAEKSKPKQLENA